MSPSHLVLLKFQIFLDLQYFLICNLRRKSREDWLSIAQACSKDVQTPWDGKTVYIGRDWTTVTCKAENGGENTVTIRTGYEIISRMIDKYGQFLFPNGIEANT